MRVSLKSLGMILAACQRQDNATTSIPVIWEVEIFMMILVRATGDWCQRCHPSWTWLLNSAHAHWMRCSSSTCTAFLNVTSCSNSLDISGCCSSDGANDDTNPRDHDRSESFDHVHVCASWMCGVGREAPRTQRKASTASRCEQDLGANKERSA